MTSPEMSGGASGYFSSPAATLDPNLFFDGDKLRDDVRNTIAGNLGAWLAHNGWQVHQDWVHLWLTGSGVSYQWSADRGNGDLDVMVSIDVAPLIEANPQIRGWGEDEIAAHLTSQMREDLWPRMANTIFGDRTYEVTYYWNPGTYNDIRNIHPYAAIDILSGAWVVRPPKLPQDPATLYPQSWFDATAQDHAATSALFAEYGHRVADVNHASPAVRANATSALARIAAQARALYDDIHLGRHGAFTQQGTGYGDFRNYRWQRAKQLGHAEALRQLAAVGDTPDPQYGTINPADVTARRAALWRSKR